jgi:hypothetical protein
MKENEYLLTGRSRATRRIWTQEIHNKGIRYPNMIRDQVETKPGKRFSEVVIVMNRGLSTAITSRSVQRLQDNRTEDRICEFLFYEEFRITKPHFNESFPQRSYFEQHYPYLQDPGV